MSEARVSAAARIPPSRFETLLLTLLRVGIGWHFAYEGLVKILDPSWSSAGYLRGADWIGADLFHAIASNPTALYAVDLLNMWGLFLIGLALMLGCFTRFAALFGVVVPGENLTVLELRVAQQLPRVDLGEAPVQSNDGLSVLLSVRDRDKEGAVELAHILVNHGFEIAGTHGTAQHLNAAGVKCRRVNKVREGRPQRWEVPITAAPERP